MKPGTLLKIIGCVGIVGATVAASDFGPLATKIALTVTTCANSFGILIARQNNVTSEEACPTKTNPPATP